jgi:subtilisin family serine protease
MITRIAGPGYRVIPRRDKLNCPDKLEEESDMNRSILTFFTALVLIATVMLAQSWGGEINPLPDQSDNLCRDLDSLRDCDFIEGRLLVRFKSEFVPGPGSEIESSIASEKFDEWGVTLNHAYYGPLAGLYLVEGNFRVRELLPVVRADSTVKYAEPDGVVYLDYQPNDPHAQSGTAGGDHFDLIGAFSAWDDSKGDPNIVIAVIDTGALLSHDDIAGNLWTDPTNGSHGWNFNDDNADLSDCQPGDGHGTATACAAAGVGDNNKGTAGIAFKSRIAVIKAVLGGASTCVKALQYAADKRFKVVSASWHVFTSKQAVFDAINVLNANGQLLICAAANLSENIDQAGNELYPACLTNPNIITVMNTDMSDKKYSTSNWGPVSVDLAAPGVDIYMASADGGYWQCTGTSIATPLVSGACALIWSRNPSKGHLEIKSCIMANTDPVTSISGMCVSGGRLNVKAASDAIGGSSTPAPPSSSSGSKKKSGGCGMIDTGSRKPPISEIIGWLLPAMLLLLALIAVRRRLGSFRFIKKGLAGSGVTEMC